jgi:antitoxin VapB
MLATAKVFTSGNSQAIRLPKAFRVDAREVWISKNEVTGDITLRPKESEDQRQRNLAELFRLIAENPFTEDFIPPRTQDEPRNPFADQRHLPALTLRMAQATQAQTIATSAICRAELRYGQSLMAANDKRRVPIDLLLHELPTLA